MGTLLQILLGPRGRDHAVPLFPRRFFVVSGAGHAYHASISESSVSRV